MPKRKRQEEIDDDDQQQDVEDEQDNDSQDMSNDDDDNDEQEPTKRVSKEQLEIMEQKLAANPYSYDAHLQYIYALRNNSDVEGLRKARENMSQCFPLSQDQWLQWLQDEESIATTNEEIAKVKTLYERAFQDYQLAKVWEQYCEFILKHFPNDKEMIESTFERAVQTAGAHMLDGNALWTMYRNYERTINNKNKIRELFQRQLVIPSLQLTNVFEGYESFETNPQEAEKVKIVFQEASKKLEERIGIEEKLVEASHDKDEAERIWLEYLDLVMKEDSQELAIQMFERAVQEQCLSERIWNRYIHYLKTAGASAQTLVMVYNNASRNCSWSSSLWCGFVEYLELCKCDPQLIENSFQRALSSMPAVANDYISIFLAQCSYMMRNKGDEEVRNSFVNAFEYIMQYFPEGDRLCQLERLWAHVEAHRFKDLERAREIYRNIISRFPTEAALWFNYVQFLHDIGSTKEQIRQVYRQAVQSLDNNRSKKSLAMAWAQFEREVGEGIEKVMEAEAIIHDAREQMELEDKAKPRWGNKKPQDKKGGNAKKGKKDTLGKRKQRDQRDENMREKQAEQTNDQETQVLAQTVDQEYDTKTKEDKKKKKKPPKKKLQKEQRANETKQELAQQRNQPVPQPAKEEVKPPPTKKRALMKPRSLAPTGQPLTNADFKKLFEK